MRYGDQNGVWDKALYVRLMIMEAMIMPTSFNNTEMWTNITKQEMEIIEKSQKDILTSLFHLPISTPSQLLGGGNGFLRPRPRPIYVPYCKNAAISWKIHEILMRFSFF